MFTSALAVRRWSCAILVFGLVATTPAVWGDTILKRNGEKLIGKIVAEEAKRVQIEVRQGKIKALVWVARKDIFQIEKGMTPEEEFEERLSKLEELDLAGHEALLDWAKKKRLRRRARDLEKKLPIIRLKRLRIDHPRHWCRTCDASGKEKCVPCAGEGHILETCKVCEGSGATGCKSCGHKESALLKCRRCGGNGEFERFDPKKGRKVRVKCNDCRGKGTHECPTCDGSREQPCAACAGKKGTPHVCRVCRGTPSRTCTTCGGKGLQPKAVDDATLEKEQAEAAKKKAEEAKKAADAAKAGPREGREPAPEPKGSGDGPSTGGGR